MPQATAFYVLLAVVPVFLLGVVALAGGGVYYFVIGDGKAPDPVAFVDGKPAAKPEIDKKRPVPVEEKKPEPILLKGTLTRDDPVDNFGAAQTRFHKVHLIPLESGQPYLIDLEGTFDTFLRIETSDKKVLSYNDDMCPPDNLDSRLVFTPAKKDTYRVIVTSFQPKATGSYTLCIQHAVKIDDPVVIKGRLGNMNGGPVFHRIKLAGDSAYSMELTSPNFETSFALKVAGLFMARSSVIPGNPVRLDYTTPGAGDFEVSVGRPGQTGEYTLSIQRYESPKKKEGEKKTPPVDPGAPRVYDVGTGLLLRGKLDKLSSNVVCQVKLTAGKSYVIDMVSPDTNALDPFLLLTDAAGKRLAQDDDSGGGLNARIRFSAEQTAVFRIVATSFNSGVGPFTLTVREGVDPKLAKVTPAQAQGLASRGDWNAAAAAYAKFFADHPLHDGEHGFEYAAVLLLSGDQGGYRKICAEMLDRSGQVGIRPYHVARACTLAPDSVKDADLPGKNAEGELARNSTEFWAHTERGALAYRAGKYDEAATHLAQSLQTQATQEAAVLNWCWLAMVEHRRGKPAEARARLDKATKWLKQFPEKGPRVSDDGKEVHLHNWLEALILHREAEALIEAKK